ncbi:MAG: AAA family ATPase [Kiritimatiellae bacterium]|nr:AAA family ATPase [Kiritimatiellia bacterium]
MIVDKVKWGAGCLIEIAVLLAVSVVFTQEQLNACIRFMVILAIPSWLLRHFLFTERTPDWLRMLFGPMGLLLCVVLGYFIPISVSNAADPENVGGKAAETVETKKDAEPPESAEAVLAQLDDLVGLEGVKAEVKKIVNLVKINEARKAQGLKVPPMTYHMVFTGNPGTGKTTVARLVARAFVALGIIGNRTIVEVDRSSLVGRYMGETSVKTNQKIDEAMGIRPRFDKSGKPVELTAEQRIRETEKAPGGVLFVDEAYQLVNGDNDDYGKEAIATILKRMEDNRDKLIVIAAGYTDEMRDFLDANSGLRSRFARTIEFADYTAVELAKIFRSMAKKNQFTLAEDLDKGLGAAIEKLTKKRDRTFGNARFIRQLFEDATGRQANRLAEAGKMDAAALTTLTLADLGLKEKKEDVRAPTIEEVLAELDSLTGMQPVKDEIRRLIASCRANKLREEKGVEGNVTMSYNFVFTGNPGTGKTTVARILGKAFRALGILDRANFVETDRSGLVAKYEGQTALKTNRLIDSAKGGILFIDEAYQLNQGENDQFGSEAVATLLKRMEDSRGSMVVIIAGYKEEMKKFMAINSGLESRFNRTIEFPDFTTKELGTIFRSMAKKGKYKLSADVEHWLNPYIAMLTKKKSKAFGNARWVRNLFEKSVERQSLRIVDLKDPSAEELVTLRLKDVGISLKDPNASAED